MSRLFTLPIGGPVIVTAKEGTALPFDQNAIPCHFWNLAAGAEANIHTLGEFVEKNMGRPPLVGDSVNSKTKRYHKSLKLRNWDEAVLSVANYENHAAIDVWY
jgi:hypothetical protein